MIREEHMLVSIVDIEELLGGRRRRRF